MSIDPDRIEEWVRANYDDETRVTIQTVHGTGVYTRGDPLSTECPVCDEPVTLVQGFGENREWVHVGEDRRCSLEVTDSAE